MFNCFLIFSFFEFLRMKKGRVEDSFVDSRATKRQIISVDGGKSEAKGKATAAFFSGASDGADKPAKSSKKKGFHAMNLNPEVEIKEKKRERPCCWCLRLSDQWLRFVGAEGDRSRRVLQADADSKENDSFGAVGTRHCGHGENWKWKDCGLCDSDREPKKKKKNKREQETPI
jgi:hypothetical protein